MYDFRYTPTDEEIRLAYHDILTKFAQTDLRDTNYHEDIALLMAHINKLLVQESDETVSTMNLEKWKIILETIKLKATLIKEQRLERERQEKAEERRMKLTAIPVDDFKNAIASLISIVCKHVSVEQMPSVITELNEVVATYSPKQNLQ